MQPHRKNPIPRYQRIDLDKVHAKDRSNFRPATAGQSPEDGSFKEDVKPKEQVEYRQPVKRQ